MHRLAGRAEVKGLDALPKVDDANLEVIRTRLETYERETKPVLDFYGTQLVHTIDATQPPETVLRDILNHISRI